VCYGRIQSIIEHKLFKGSDEAHVLIECEWYSPTGLDTPSGLLQVSYDAQLSQGSRWTFLKDMYRNNVVLWPTYAHSPNFQVVLNTFAVLEHTATFAGDVDDDDDDVGDEEGDEGMQ